MGLNILCIHFQVCQKSPSSSNSYIINGYIPSDPLDNKNFLEYQLDPVKQVERNSMNFSNYHSEFCRCFCLLKCHYLSCHVVFGSFSKFECSVADSPLKRENFEYDIFSLKIRVIKKLWLLHTDVLLHNLGWKGIPHIYRHTEIWLGIFHIKNVRIFELSYSPRMSNTWKYILEYHKVT